MSIKDPRKDAVEHFTTTDPTLRDHPDGETRRPLRVRGTRAFDLPVKIGDSDWAKKVVVGDFTGDGKPDFAVLHWETGGRCVVGGVEYDKGFLVVPYLNTTPPGATPATFTAMPGLSFVCDWPRIYPMYPSDIAVGDVNGDGKDDIVVANAHEDRIFVYLSNGDGTFQPPIEIDDTGNDDPSYIALGDFDGDGKLDIAVLNLRRHFPGENFEWTLAFLFGNGDGTFQKPVKLDLGDWSFGGDADDGGGYYKSTTFSMTTMKKSAVVSGVPRDAVNLNGAKLWWDGAQIQTSGSAVKQFQSPIGTYVMEHYAPGRADLATVGGRELRSSGTIPGDTLQSAANLTQLDRAIRGRNGEGITGDFFGTHVIVDDFDGDGFLDVLLFSDGGGERFVGQQMFMAYGYSDIIHPLTLPAPTPITDLSRLKFFPNSNGWWSKGHRAWHAAVADFDGDGYLDILTLTVEGVMLHMNLGKRGYQGLPPTIQQVYRVSPHDPGEPGEPWYGDTLSVQYALSDARPAMGVVLRAVAPGSGGVFLALTPDAKNPSAFGTVVVPDDDVLPPGEYDITLHNGVVESKNSVRITIIRRPIAIKSIKLHRPEKGKRYAEVEVTGFFGIVKDLSQATFTLEKTSSPLTQRVLTQLSLRETIAQLAIPLFMTPGPHTLTVDHKTRGKASISITIPDYKPKLISLHWDNPGGRTGGTLIPGKPMVGKNPQPGATFIFEATMLYAPNTKDWKLLDASSKVVKSGSSENAVGAIGYSNDNDQAAYFLNLPTDITIGSGYHFGVTTELGVDSELAGPLTFEAAPATMPPLPLIWVYVEFLDHGRVGYANPHGYPALEYNETDPTKPKGALQRAQEMFPGNYEFTKVEAHEAAHGGGLHNARGWNFKGVDDKGKAVTGTVFAVSEKRARVNAIDEFDLVSIEPPTRRDGDP